MKKLIFLLLLSGCAVSPPKKLMMNCEEAGNGLYYCEEIPRNQIKEIK